MKKLRDIFKKDSFYVDKDGYAVPSTHLTYRDVNMSVDEDVQTKTNVLDWARHNENKHLGKDSKSISKKLESRQPKIDESHLPHIGTYTDDSGNINRHLISSHKVNKEPGRYKNTIKALDAATNNPIQDHVHMYTGIGFHPGKMLKKTKDNTIHLPAYTSMSHDKDVAKGFAQMQSNFDSGAGFEKHIIHLHMKPGDKMVHISHVSDVPVEHESVLPRNTKLKLNPRPEHMVLPGSKIHHYIWHAEVSHQE